MASSSTKQVCVGINGFGRMGRLFLRAAWKRWDHIKIVHINDIASDARTSAYLLTHDSVHGRWSHQVQVDSSSADRLVIDGEHAITLSRHASPSLVPWSALGISIVVECSGAFVTLEKLNAYFTSAQYIPKVVVSAPVKGALNIVMGVNDHEYDPSVNHIITAASCTTNCLAPVVKVLHESIGIIHGSMTTVHNVTNTQAVVDMPMKGDKDLRRTRACGESLVPTTTGSATAISLIFPELKGKLNGLAIRVPLLNASITDCVFEMKRPVTAEEINELFTKASKQGPLKGILAVENEPLVSVDFKDNPHSAIIDALSTMVIDSTHLKLLAWYDNEVGYATRLAELVAKVGASSS